MIFNQTHKIKMCLRTKRISVGGIEFPSIREAAEASSQPVGRFRDRLRSDWTPEQAAGLVPPPTFAHKKRHLEIDGFVYASVVDLTKKFGIPSRKIRGRLDSNNWTLRQAVELDPPPKKLGKKILVSYRDTEYRNAAELARAFNVDSNKYRSRRRKGWNLEQALDIELPPSRQSWRANAEVIGGRAYPKGNDGEFMLYVITCFPTGKEYVGVTTGSLQKRWGEHLSNSMHKVESKSKLYRAIRKYGTDKFKIELLRDDACDYKELLQQEINEVTKRNTFKDGLNSTPGGETTSDARPIEVQGKTFPTLRSAAAHFGVSEANTRSRLDALGWTVEQAVGVAPRPTDWGPKEIELEGVMYQSLKDATKAYRLTYKKISLRLNRYGWTLEEAFELIVMERPTGAPKNIDFRGIKYESYVDLARSYGISKWNFYSRYRKGWTLEQALALEIRPRPRPPNAITMIYKGKKYETLKELALDFGVSYKLLSARLNKGWSHQKAINSKISQ